MTIARAFEQALPAITKSSTGPDRVAYARDLWPKHHLAVTEGRVAEHAPALIAWPESTEDVAKIVRFAASEGLALAPFGAGSGVCGGILPNDRTIVMDLKRMNRVRKLDRDAPLLDVEAGALGIRLEEDMGREGFTIGHFPSSIVCSTAGGWVAARGAGQCSGLYGKIEDMVAALEMVDGRGDVITLNRRVHGPDLTPLIIGSEGTLGVVTSVALRLHPAPRERAFGAFSFRSIEAGWSAMRAMFQAGIRPAVARLYDPFDSFMARMGSVRRARKRGDAHAEKSGPKAPGRGAAVLRGILRAPHLLNEAIDVLGDRVLRGSTLVLVFEGTAEHARADLDRAQAIASQQGAKSLGEEPARHWLAHRYSVSYRQAPMFMAGTFADTMEVAAPWSALAALYRDVRAALGKRVFVMAHLSHAYPDGCSIYFTFAGSAPSVAEAEATYDAAWRDALDAAIRAGGTLSHHHGVGRSKAPKLGAELGLGVDMVRALRRALDPSNVMNPGNLLPERDPPRAPPRALPDRPVLDAASSLLHARGDATLASVAEAIRARGLVPPFGEGAPPLDQTTLASWIAEGAWGSPDPWRDPVDHLVAGFTARLPSGAELVVRPCPRRAVGPDLFSLYLGARERAGVITSVWLRALHPQAPRPLHVALDRDPAGTTAEREWIDRAIDAAAGVR